MPVSIQKEKDELKREIINRKDDNLPALIFQRTDFIIRAVSGRKSPLPIWYIILFLALLIQLPTLLISILMQEMNQWKVLGLTWIGYLEIGLIATVMVYYQHRYLAHELGYSFVDFIHRKGDLLDLKKSLDKYWNVRQFGIYTILFSVFWCIAFSFVNSLYLGQFIGFGLASGTIVFGLIAGSGYTYLSWFIQFTRKFGCYEFVLFDLIPVHSEIVARIKKFYVYFMYTIMGYFFLCTLANVSNYWAAPLIVVVAWIPATLLFVFYQNSLRQIITKSKWKYLNKLQSQIMILSKHGPSKEPIENINILLDHHERIRLTPNSTMDLRSALTFLNQLMLPLLGFLLANVERIINFFR